MKYVLRSSYQNRAVLVIGKRTLVSGKLTSVSGKRMGCVVNGWGVWMGEKPFHFKNSLFQVVNRRLLLTHTKVRLPITKTERF